MNSTALKLSLIIAVGFMFRLALLTTVDNPGLHDPVHYFNLGRRLSQGQGFTIDYVWHYSRLPSEITHSIDHWMPLTGVAVALGVAAGGANLHASLTLFILAGTLAPLLVFLATKQHGQPESCALVAASFAAVLPELVLNSLRTDTTIVNLVLVVSAVLFLNKAIKSSKRLGFMLGGLLFGLAHLTRNDSIILFSLLVPYLLLADAMGSKRVRRTDILLVVVAFGLTILPWHLRNLYEIGTLGSTQISRMPFMVEPTDLYAYGIPITFESMLVRQSLADLVGKRFFEFGAALKQMIVSLQFPLAVLVPAGIFRLCVNGDRRLLLRFSPVLIWLAGILIIYPILMPVHSQGGSFKKVFLTVLPLLIPFGSMAMDQLNLTSRWRRALLLASLCWLAWSSYDLVRRETVKADTFYNSMQVMVDKLQTLPDMTGDNEIRLMSQDPYVLSAFGFASLTTPLATREDTLALARQYEVDYLLMPAGRPALDTLYLGEEHDPRFVLAAHLADAGEIPFELYSFVYDG